jgi:anaerobic ribonucleoside-triphosphate reductase activating protein
MKKDILWINHFEPISCANGPGRRFVLWLQGCSQNCPGCFNPSTHPFNIGKAWSIDQIYKIIMRKEDQIEGITLSGGEPLEQRGPLLHLLQKIAHETHLSIILLTGYNWQEVQEMPEYTEMNHCVDVILAGPYREDLRTAHQLTGSSNKTFHFLTSTYSHKNFESIPDCEAVIKPDGEILISGINPIRW